MTDLVVTAANVVAGSNAVIDTGVAGATITAGQPVYREASTKRFKASDNNAATAEARAVYGISLNGASAGQPLQVQKDGDLVIGATLTAGVEYYLSATAGGICPVGDLSTGMYTTAIGIAKSTTVLALNIQSSGVAL